MVYTQRRGHTLGYGNGFFPVGPAILETPEHTFFACIKEQREWAGNALYFEVDPYAGYLTGTFSFIDILNSGLEKPPIGMARLFVIYQISWTLWLHRKIGCTNNIILGLHHGLM